jgi:beta-glucosidase-like glycosyl hydrolase
MISSAVYPAISRSSPAVTAPAVYERELPAALGRAGHITISDALDTPALKGENKPALRAIDAGLDLALFPGNERESALAYKELVADMRRGALPESRLRSAVYAIEALKRLVR